MIKVVPLPGVGKTGDSARIYSSARVISYFLISSAFRIVLALQLYQAKIQSLL